jgi:hypothetical protein
MQFALMHPRLRKIDVESPAGMVVIGRGFVRQVVVDLHRDPEDGP